MLKYFTSILLVERLKTSLLHFAMQVCASIVLFIFLVPKASACLNGTTTALKDGSLISMERGKGIVPYGHRFYERNYPQALQHLDSLWRITKDPDYRSDYGLVLILQGKYNKAIALYLDLERANPNRYSTASNLGTAYELAGRNNEALRWIRRAIEIDSNSHDHSEWLHVKILEAKAYGEKYINSDSLINTNFGSSTMPKTTLQPYKLLELRNALYYQLNERVSFIKQEDKIVAQLLFDLGNVAFLTDQKQAAESIYTRAQHYGFADPLLQTRIDYLSNSLAFDRRMAAPEVTVETHWYNAGTILGFGLLALGAILVYFIVKPKKSSA